MSEHILIGAKKAVISAACGICALPELELLKRLEELYLTGFKAAVDITIKDHSLYHRLNEMLAILGAEGQIDTRHKTVTAVMDCLHSIDGGMYENRRAPSAEQQFIQVDGVRVDAEWARRMRSQMIDLADHRIQQLKAKQQQQEPVAYSGFAPEADEDADVSDCGIHTIGIHVSEGGKFWWRRISCCGRTLDEAKALRDFVLQRLLYTHQQPQPQAPDSGRWSYFVGNANGRGLIRIEVEGRHIASMPRGPESEDYARRIVAAMNGEQPQAQGEPVAPTPSSRWAANGEPDPHEAVYNCERAKLAHGSMTDDELANAVYLDPCIGNLTAAKERIRWLSRRLAEKPRAAVPDAVTLTALAKELRAIASGVYRSESFEDAQQRAEWRAAKILDQLAAAPAQPVDAQGGEG